MTSFFQLPALLIAAAALLSAGAVFADVAHVAVASNFAEPIKALAVTLEQTTGHQIKVTLGATGKFYAQVKNGAPFDVLLAANTETPAALESDGFAVPGSRFTYATGRLVLWSADASLVDDKGEVLLHGKFRKLAYAAPKVAPYGAAAVQVMNKLGITNLLTPKLVQGESIGQTFSFVFTGNAELGFVALSQVLEGGRLKSGSMWDIPQALYQPIAQNAVLLKRGASNPAAQAFMSLLKTQSSKDLIRSYGYAP